MRALFALLLMLPTEAVSWEFFAQPICTLTHENEAAELVIDYDPALSEYRLNIQLKEGVWAYSRTFGMSFQNQRPIVIGTDRQTINGPNLTVRDKGFSNVLDGLEFNLVATAMTGSQTVGFSLFGAAEPVQQFRDCAKRILILS